MQESDAEPAQNLIPDLTFGGENSHGLESLPPEIRRLILQALDLPSLSALVHASPAFHHQYILERRRLLCQNLEKALGSAAIDAYAVCRATYGDRQEREDAVALLDRYREEKLIRRFDAVDELTEDQAVKMTAFYLRCVVPFTEYFTRWTLGNLGRELDKKIERNITSTETLRFHRAAYRFELLCQVAGRETAFGARQIGASVSVLDLVMPWEDEEILCILEFALTYYDAIFKRILWDLNPEHPKFAEGRPPTLEGPLDLNETNWIAYQEGTALSGLSVLCKVLFETKDHQDLVITMDRHMARTGMLLMLQQRFFETDADMPEHQRVPVPFRGDEDPDSPPSAWIAIFGTNSGRYGAHVPEEMRYWGYVFWDEATLTETGGMELMDMQWQRFLDEDNMELSAEESS